MLTIQKQMKEDISILKMKKYYKHYVKNLKRQLMTKDFLCRLQLHISNWKACPRL